MSPIAVLATTTLAITTPQVVIVTTTSAVSIEQIKLNRVLKRGTTGEDVKKLQQVLASFPDIYPEGLITGYFGKLTEKAVRQLQAKQGIVSSGSPETTGFGQVGPKTLSVINEVVITGSSGGVSVPTQESGATVLQSNIKTTNTPQSLVTVSSTSSIPIVIPQNTASTTYTSSSGFGSGGVSPSTPIFVVEPHPAVQATSSDASSTPNPPPPSPLPASDTTGPTITNLSITPTTVAAGGQVSFTATAEDPSGVQNLVYVIQYPGTSYSLQPNCNFNGVTSGTCAFGESVDHGIKDPTILGDYVITSIRITDTLGNVATYYPNGTVSGGASATHSLSIPAITVTAL